MPFSMAFLASIAFSLASFREVAGVGAEGNQLFLAHECGIQSSAFACSGVMSRYSPLPSKSFCAFLAGFAARMAVSVRGMGVILLQGFYYLDMYPKMGMSMYLFNSVGY